MPFMAEGFEELQKGSESEINHGVKGQEAPG